MDRTLTENDVMVIKSLNADLRAAAADPAAAQGHIWALEAENERLRDALQPFAALASFDGWNTSAASGKDATVYQNDNGKLTRGDFDNALEALQAKEAE